MSRKEPRQLKELRNLMPFAWDARKEKHPPGTLQLLELTRTWPACIVVDDCFSTLTVLAKTIKLFQSISTEKYCYFWVGLRTTSFYICLSYRPPLPFQELLRCGISKIACSSLSSRGLAQQFQLIVGNGSGARRCAIFHVCVARHANIN